jgi:RNA polymerase sigma factor (TIGR02999 family)
MPGAEDVTVLLRELRSGDSDAGERLFALVYTDLKAMARRELRREKHDHTLQATALVHEAYLRLAGKSDAADRQHFFAMASRAMRCILIDHARNKDRDKRGGGWKRVELDQAVAGAATRGVDLLALEDALEKLESTHPERVRLVELRYFGGLSLEDACAVMGTSRATAKREWAAAKVWLFRELSAHEH